MRIVVTGSAGHLGEAVVRSLQGGAHDVVGVDILESPFTSQTGSIVDRGFVAQVLDGVDAVVHAAALQRTHHGFAEMTRADGVEYEPKPNSEFIYFSTDVSLPFIPYSLSAKGLQFDALDDQVTLSCCDINGRSVSWLGTNGFVVCEKCFP